MQIIERDSPCGKKVSLFATCMVDMLYPQTGWSVVRILDHLGVKVDFPMGQTCCGQPAFNAGYHDEARSVARNFLAAFKDAEVIVIPSGSCASMIRVEYPALFQDDPQSYQEAKRLASITWEFTEYLVDGLGLDHLGGRLAENQTFAVHDSCHGLRMMGIKSQPRKLIDKIENAQRIKLESEEQCCGFGGLFSIKLPNVSGAILEKKLRDVSQNDADWIIVGDVSCMTNMNTGLEKRGLPKKVRHIADLLAESLGERDRTEESGA